jgi:histidinol phosphatase-like PHP family hydrolase
VGGFPAVSNFPFVDWHVHTRYSECCKENYGVFEVGETAEKAGLTGVGIADHSNDQQQNVKFLQTQRHEMITFGLQSRMRLGLEVTILDRQGHLGVNPKALDRLDFVLLAEHLHIAKMFNEFHGIKTKAPKWHDAGNVEKLRDLGVRTHELMCAGLQSSPPHAILAHPWRFFLSKQIFEPELLELTPRLCEIAQERGIALEMPAAHLKVWLDRDQQRPKYEFIRSFWRIVGKYDLRIALGSDAHHLEDVGACPDISPAFNDFGLSPLRLLRLDDVPFKEES